MASVMFRYDDQNIRGIDRIILGLMILSSAEETVNRLPELLHSAGLTDDPQPSLNDPVVDWGDRNFPGALYVDGIIQDSLTDDQCAQLAKLGWKRDSDKVWSYYHQTKETP